MEASAVPLLAIFEKKLRLEVPLFQRQYIWNCSQQWEPLWEDISRKFIDYIDGRKDSPVHFLGAMVLDQKQTPITHVEKRQVIDGQQRLTTLQIFLAAFRDFCKSQYCDDLANECDSFILNKGMMADPEIDKFKVWPTQADRQQFSDVIVSKSINEVENKYPLVYKKRARKPEPRPRMVEAYIFFFKQIDLLFNGNENEQPISSDIPICIRLEECFQALKNSLKVVVIDLQKDDDAQIIFETLNARGEPLLPADLLRNYIFLRAARQGEPQEALYENFWRKFDDHFWRIEVKQGRLFRPRSDLFIQHFLASRQSYDIPIKHLFVEYKYWIEKCNPFSSVREELSLLSKQGDDFRRIIEPKKDDNLYSLSTFLDIFDVRTCYPLLLTFLDMSIDETEWPVITEILESYILRRAVCGLTTKNYNRVFLTLTRTLRRDGVTSANLRKLLLDQTGESAEWPSDDTFKEAWRSRHVYQSLNNPKLVHIFKRLNKSYLGKKSETIEISGLLTIEHIMPQNWIKHWPLPCGSLGLNSTELWNAEPTDPRTINTRKRNALIHTFGNLTILTQSLNSAALHSPWEAKKSEILRYSLLPINQQFLNLNIWDEDAIIRRGDEIFEHALKIWPRQY
jgi:uncharacterized protein with ParB-like and HNH nuclease domain